MRGIKPACQLTQLLLFYNLLVGSVYGQYNQEVDIQHLSNNAKSYSWDVRNDGKQILPVADLKDQVVILYYNCYYMNSICNNAESVLGKTSSKVYTYDINSKRAEKRRRHKNVCGGNWKTQHTCPEKGGQPKPWRWDSLSKDLEQWPETKLEQTVPGLAYNIIDEADIGGVTTPSYLRWSCDEFPPASWIEGGGGLGSSTNTNTYCAAWHCTRGITKSPMKSGVTGEQNWQGIAHGRLRENLKMLASADKKSDYVKDKSPIRFTFATYNDKNSKVPAKLQIVSTVPGGSSFDQLVPFPNPPKKRGEPNGRNTELFTVSTLAEALNLGNMSVDVEHKLQNFLVNKPTQLYSLEVPIHANETELDLELSSPRVRSVFMNDATASNEDENFNETAFNGAFYLPEFISRRTSLNGSAVREQISGEESIHSHAAETVILKARSSSDAGPLVKNTTASELEKAIRIIEAAADESSARNEARMANPARNRYTAKPNTKTSSSIHQRGTSNDDKEDPPPLLKISPELAAYAALVAEADASQNPPATANSTKHEARGSSYWMESIKRRGTVPWGDDPDYKVFRNVKDYGAKGDGKTDDTAAFRKAIEDGRRCGAKCNGSTVKNAIIYIPSGEYLISSSVQLYYGTQLIGNPSVFPKLVASKRFIGLGVISTDQYTGGGVGADGLDQEWYINTANFYRQIRNIEIDITAINKRRTASGIHYQVAQATILQNIAIHANSEAKQSGIFSENGSGGTISDIIFYGGQYGFYGGNQQFTAQRLVFKGCKTAVRIIWDWGWVWKSILVQDSEVGFQLEPDDKKKDKRGTIKAGDTGNIASMSFLDSFFISVDKAVVVKKIDKTPASGSTGVIFQNVQLHDVKSALTSGGKTVLKGGSQLINSWATGPLYMSGKKRSFSTGEDVAAYDRPAGLLKSDSSDKPKAFYERSKPQYNDEGVDAFKSLKSLGAAGDGVTDDTAAVQSALYQTASEGSILFADAGSYLIKKTVIAPPGARIVGEAWTQLVATGDFFGDASNPKPMLKVGQRGDLGSVEMQDLLFTTKGPTPGAVLVEWNIKASKKGSAALWDCHVRIGGATGTELTPQECPPSTSGTDSPKCQAASMMMHITSGASGIFDNMWLWVADHMIDDPKLDDPDNDMVQTSIYVARGLLVESRDPVWLYGTASEHAIMYQYSFDHAANVFAGMLQTESPYFQPTPKPPAPFDDAVGIYSSDPSYTCKKDSEFSGCDSSWAIVMRKLKNIFIAGAGAYSWFSTYSQDCIDTQKCQKALLLIEDNYKNNRIQHLITIGAKYMAVIDGKGLDAKENLNVKDHPSWSQVSVLEIDGKDGSPEGTDNGGDAIWIDPIVWKPANPVAQCQPPCELKLPPWPSFKTTLNYPEVVVITGTITTTYTDLTTVVSEWLIEPETVLPHGRNGQSTDSSGEPVYYITPKIKPTSTWSPINVTMSGLPGNPVVSVLPGRNHPKPRPDRHDPTMMTTTTATDENGNNSDPHYSMATTATTAAGSNSQPTNTSDDPDYPQPTDNDPEESDSYSTTPPPAPPPVGTRKPHDTKHHTWPPPLLTIHPGKPRPTTFPCQWSDKDCGPAPPPSGDHSGGGGGDDGEDGGDPEDESDEDPDSLNFCFSGSHPGDDGDDGDGGHSKEPTYHYDVVYYSGGSLNTGYSTYPGGGSSGNYHYDAFLYQPPDTSYQHCYDYSKDHWQFLGYQAEHHDLPAKGEASTLHVGAFKDKCYYSGTTKSVGSLHCTKFKKPVTCFQVPKAVAENWHCSGRDENIEYMGTSTTVIRCAWKGNEGTLVIE